MKGRSGCLVRLLPSDSDDFSIDTETKHRQIATPYEFFISQFSNLTFAFYQNVGLFHNLKTLGILSSSQTKYLFFSVCACYTVKSCG